MDHFVVFPVNEDGIFLNPKLVGKALDDALSPPFNFSDVFIYSHGWRPPAAARRSAAWTGRSASHRSCNVLGRENIPGQRFSCIAVPMIVAARY